MNEQLNEPIVKLTDAFTGLIQAVTAMQNPVLQLNLPSLPTLRGKRPYERLRCALEDRGIRQCYIAKNLGVTSPTVSNRLSGKYDWPMKDVYAVMDLLKLPYEHMSAYFPKDGKS